MKLVRGGHGRRSRLLDGVEKWEYAHLFGHSENKIKYCELASNVNGGGYLPGGVTRHVVLTAIPPCTDREVPLFCTSEGLGP